MKKTIVLLFVLSITAVVFAEEVKKADLAGSWYPGSPSKLAAMLDGFLKDTELPNIPSDIIAIIVPHAGYIYSGSVAAYSYNAVSQMEIDTVILVGFSHRKYFNAISIYDRGEFETPLGSLKVDQDMARELMLSHDKFYFNPEAFKDENSIETQLPFIKHIFKKDNVKIVPIAMGVQSYENVKILGNNLYELLKDKDKYLIVTSTDMSHYHKYSEANAMDELAIKTLEKMEPKELFDKVSFEKCEVCGIGPVTASMIAAKKLGAGSIEILKYANSGDTTSKKDNVVGYISAVMYKKESSMLNKEQEKKLLQIARETLELFIKEKKTLDVLENDPVLNKELGAFVTIHKNGELRGCIGNIIGQGPLCLTIRDMAIESSTEDPRFSPVTAGELPDIDIEISVLSEMKKIEDPDVIEIGKHGVLVKKGFQSGVYLPQVGAETGWSRDEFMTSLCAHKAGLPPDAWKTGACDIYIFTAHVFSE